MQLAICQHKPITPKSTFKLVSPSYIYLPSFPTIRTHALLFFICLGNHMSTRCDLMEASSIVEGFPGDLLKRTTLQRVGSGASDVIDPAEVGVEAEAESGRRLPSSRFKGVVPQPNGRWGAQIYEKHRRVWLGTFGDEATAAHAYDAAAQRFRGRDAVTNFKALDPADDADAAELWFLCAHSKAEIVDMLRKHTYADELRLSNSSSGAVGKPNGSSTPYGAAAAVRERRKHLFEKAVTPSDVGKLNRLVIPKQHAEKHLPLLTGGGTERNGVLLSFEDDGGKIWRFRYSYWSSSQSYVLTKGWSRFVREKGLEAGDVVTFELSAGPERRIIIDHRRGPSPARVVRLFGVDIATYPAAAVGGCGGGIGKRTIDQLESFPTQELLKRQHLLAL